MSEARYERVLASREMPGARWFTGARLSYPEHIFRGRDDDAVALRHASELRELDAWTWGRLRAETARLAAALRALGVGPGDRVAAYLPNVPETVAAFLATAGLGAVWSSAAPEFGAQSVIDRFAQIEPKVLLAVDGYRYGGKDFDRGEAVERIAAALPGDPAVVRLGYLDGTGWPADLGPPAPTTSSCASSACPSTTRCGSSTPRARPGCPRRSSSPTAASCSSSSSTTGCTSTRAPATASSGSPRPAG